MKRGPAKTDTPGKHQGGIRRQGRVRQGPFCAGSAMTTTATYWTGEDSTTKYPYITRVYEVVWVKPRTRLNNFSITAETFEGAPHRAGNKGRDPEVGRVTREAKWAH